MFGEVRLLVVGLLCRSRDLRPIVPPAPKRRLFALVGAMSFQGPVAGATMARRVRPRACLPGKSAFVQYAAQGARPVGCTESSWCFLWAVVA